MLKVLFILENLGGGGAERVLPNLLRYIDKEKFDVTVLTLFSGGVNEKRLPEDVKYICRKSFYFHGMTLISRFLSPAFLYSYFIKKATKENYDVVVAYMHGLCTKTAAGAKTSRKITWLHGSMTGGYVPPLRKNFISFSRMKACLSCYDAFVGVSTQVAESFKSYTGITEKVHVIHNTNDVGEIREKAEAFNPYEKQSGVVQLVTVGHLQKVKGNDRLLEAVSRLHQEGLPFHLTILGEGPERASLEATIKANGLESIVDMPGHVDNPYPYMKNADVYVCPSRSEGFSTAVSEAIILGRPVVSTRVSGAEEILGEKNEYGIVCDNDTDALAQAVRQMVTDENLRSHYGKQSTFRADFFSPSRTVRLVEKLIEQVLMIKERNTGHPCL